ncbi:MAG TPA: HEAT repeat domain-containing protein [Pyrinomonadaceae bacterium]|nr:HEAT repeat domain-containing protein [Pyrinomonadaceae bacterium]
MMNNSTRKKMTRQSRPAAFALAAFALALAFAFVPARAAAQNSELLNRLVQSSGGSGDASRALDQGRSLIDAQRWAQAASAFDKFISEYPSDKNVDAALYWLAYAYSKQNNFQAANEALVRLFQSYPRSSWAGDGKALSVEVMSKLNPNYRPDVDEEGPDDLTIIALQALCENDRPNCSARINEILRSNKSVHVKEAAIILLGRYGGTEAVPALIQLARSEPNDKLRMRAISALGATNDERALDVLREIALGPTYEDESPTDSAIHALANHDNPRAVQILGEVAANGKNMRARTHAVEIMSRRRGDNVVDELLRLYDAVPEVQVKKYVLAGLAMRKDPRALSKLADVARSSGDPQLRRQAIRSISTRGEEETLNLLLPLYDSERDSDLKTGLLEAFGQYQDQRAYQKLEQVVQNPAEPIERRKIAISMLSRSKDPQVLKFLEDMLR